MFRAFLRQTPLVTEIARPFSMFLWILLTCLISHMLTVTIHHVHGLVHHPACAGLPVDIVLRRHSEGWTADPRLQYLSLNNFALKQRGKLLSSPINLHPVEIKEAEMVHRTIYNTHQHGEHTTIHCMERGVGSRCVSLSLLEQLLGHLVSE